MLVSRSISGRLPAAAVALAIGAAGLVAPDALAAAHAAGGGSALRSPDAQSNGGAVSQTVVQASSHTSVALESCLGASSSSAGAATFTARMSTVPGAVQMEMRFEIIERAPGEASFHRPPGVGSAALGSWRESALHVGVFKDSDEVTDLPVGAQYSARVHFRWLDAEGETVAWAQRRAEACRQPAAPTS
jgi:hypothetical protein